MGKHSGGIKTVWLIFNKSEKKADLFILILAYESSEYRKKSKYIDILRGPKGERGDKGPAGEDGDDGAVGEKGFAGDDAKSPRGPKGMF